jgi:hypothetical protein
MSAFRPEWNKFFKKDNWKIPNMWRLNRLTYSKKKKEFSSEIFNVEQNENESSFWKSVGHSKNHA